MRSRVGVFLRTMLVAVMALGMLPVMPAAPAAAAPPEWTVEWDRDVSADVGRPLSVSVAADGSYYVAGNTLAKYAADGELLWKVNPRPWGDLSPASVACDDEYVYLTVSDTSVLTQLQDGWLFKFSAADGSYIQDEKIPGWAAGFISNTPQVAVYDGVAYIALNQNGDVVMMDTGDLSDLGTVPTGLHSYTEVGGIEAGAEGVWICYSDDGPDYVGFYDYDGNESWRDEVGYMADPAYYSGWLYAPHMGSYAEGLSIRAYGAYSVGEPFLDYSFAFPQAEYIHEYASSLDCDTSGRIYAAIPEARAIVKLALGRLVEEKTIDNGIIKMTVQPNGTPAAYVWNDAYGDWVRQYYSEDCWGTVLLLDDLSYTTGYLSTGEEFTPVSNEIEVLDGGRRIVTVYDAGDSGVRVTQTFTLMDGDRYVTKDWKVENQGGQTFQHARLYHGGDTYFGGDDSASAYFDPTKSMVYLRNEEFTNWGIMGFYANPATPASHYFGGYYSDGNDYVDDETDLPDTANEEFDDAGYYLQWDTVPLLAGSTWHIQAYETWTPGGPLQVLAPGAQNVLPGTTVVLPFTLHNIGEVPQDVMLSAESDDPAWDVEVLGDATPDVGGLERIPVAVRVTVPEDATGFANITLHVDGPETNGSGSTRLTVVEADFTIEPMEAEMRTRPGGTAEQNIVITNNGDKPLRTGWVTMSDPANFNNGEGGGCQIEIAPGDNANFRVYFTPTAPGTYPCTVYIPMTSPMLLTATVQLTGVVSNDVTLTYLADEGGSIEGEATQVVVAGSDGTTVTAVPDVGYHFTEWSDGVDTAERRDLAVDDDLTVTAHFVRNQYTLSYLAGPGGSIAGEATQSVEHGSDGTTVTAVPDAGYRFTGWSDGVDAAERCDLAVTGDLAVTAAFEREDVRLEDLAGENRYLTAIAISQSSFADGAESVVIATGAQYPDAVSGSALAGALDCPILLTRSNALPPEVADEIGRLGARRAYVLGGTGAVSSTVFNQLVALLGEGNVHRLGGSDRHQTAVLVGAEVATLLGDDFEGSAFVATGAGFSDAIAASPLAAANRWPVYFSQDPAIAQKIVDAMRANGIERVFVLGGEGAVRPATEMALRSAGFEVRRIGGRDRYETAANVAAFGVADAGMKWDEGGLATGENFADALTGGAAQGKNRSVLLLTRATSLPGATGSALAAAKDDIATVRIYGGLGAVSQAVRDQVRALLAR